MISWPWYSVTVYQEELDARIAGANQEFMAALIAIASNREAVPARAKSTGTIAPRC